MLVNYESSDEEDNGGYSTQTRDSMTSTSSPPATGKKADDITNTHETHDDPRTLSGCGDGTNCTNCGQTSVTPGATKTAVVEAAEGVHTHLGYERSEGIHTQVVPESQSGEIQDSGTAEPLSLSGAQLESQSALTAVESAAAEVTGPVAKRPRAPLPKFLHPNTAPSQQEFVWEAQHLEDDKSSSTSAGESSSGARKKSLPEMQKERKLEKMKKKPLTFNEKEKRKRDLGQCSRAKNFVEEEKRILRKAMSGYD
ncbi:hypothetical protein Pelo_14824 [Pelomyxa schiedti]|nr:hypothetical protein Pelo_14824 [Pelomyxa schiedti]